MMRSIIRLCVAMITFIGPSISSAQDIKSNAIKIPVEMKPFKLTLVDEQGKPIQGVKVTARGVRCDESPGSWIGWPTDNAGDNKYVTDENGTIAMKYPVKFGRPGEWMTLNKLDFQFAHADYVADSFEFDPSQAEAEHGLVRGCRTLFTCVDENGTAIKEFGVAMAGTAGQANWKLADGEIRSSGVPDGKWQTMLVAPSADGIHRFSGVLPARFAKDKDVTIRGVKLRPGMRLSGNLSENVPRPIENGKVIAWCLPKPAGNTWGNEDASIGWSDETIISEDGTFSFPSLPTGGKIQIIALCNGWLIEGNENGRMKGIEISVNDSQVKENRVEGITLSMEQAGQIEVEVLSPDGKPLAGADVSTWPNQIMNLSGSTLLGECFKSIRGVENQISGIVGPEVDWTSPGRYIQKTNEQGKAVLRDIPLKHQQQLFVGFENLTPKLDKPANPNLFENAIQYLCDSAELKKLTVQMVPIKD